MRIFVGSLPFSITAQELDEVFSLYGEVSLCRVHAETNQGCAH